MWLAEAGCDRAGSEVALSLVGSRSTYNCHWQEVECSPLMLPTALLHACGLTQSGHLRWRVRDRWCWPVFQPSWIRAKPAVVESNCQELWLDGTQAAPGGRGGPGLVLQLTSTTLDRTSPSLCLFPRSLLSWLSHSPSTTSSKGPVMHGSLLTNRFCDLR